MALAKKLKQSLPRLTPGQLRELRAALDLLIHQREVSERPAEGSSRRRHYTYRQEYVKCGKEGCKCARGKGHGPYWYAYWKEQGKLKKRYLGKTRR